MPNVRIRPNPNPVSEVAYLHRQLLAAQRLLPLILSLFCGAHNLAAPPEPSRLYLVPFPKEIATARGEFRLDRSLLLEFASNAPPALVQQLADEITQAGFRAPVQVQAVLPASTLSLHPPGRKASPPPALRAEAGQVDYALKVERQEIALAAQTPAGLAHGVQTLRQLIRANHQGPQIPAVTIRDWPSLRWRAFQDDLTRGPSSTLDQLKAEAALGAYFKLNLFTYYMEYQYAFTKHPAIGPKEGSLTPAELAALVAFARPLQLEILGNQQSFGHFTSILAHPEYADLRETEYLLCPTNEKTYALLDDLFSDVIPLLPFAGFNVCCDETDGLGQGPSKPVADRIGVGALYVQHILRLHQLVHAKYGKRMMMWGDIILRHPEELPKIPKDVIMLSWGYDPRPSFEDQILPFARSGYEFFVCPGVNNWSRILPDLNAATTNIQHFVRDGAKHGALGVLNTAWDDDGETFNAPNWHGFAWGAECAWNSSRTDPDDFNRRLGPVLFGDRLDRFAQAISFLSRPGLAGLPNAEFWRLDLDRQNVPHPEEAIAQWTAQRHRAHEAVAQLQGCQRDAATHAELLDYFVFGAQRLEAHYQRLRDQTEAAVAYRAARRFAGEQRDQFLDQAVKALTRSRQTYATLRDQFAKLWARENRPYALDWTLRRYDQALAKFDTVLNRLAEAKLADPDAQLPTPAALGLQIIETAK